jgi:small subunit ribosomal protein S6
MPLYENIFIARQDISTAQTEALTETFAGIIAEHGGTVSKKEYWGLKNIAFRIKKNRKGHYVLMNIDAPAPAVLEMERNMRLNEDVLRYMSIKVDELEEGPSAMLSNRGERSERGGRGRDRDDRYGDEGDRPRRSYGDGRFEGGIE